MSKTRTEKNLQLRDRGDLGYYKNTLLNKLKNDSLLGRQKKRIKKELQKIKKIK